MVKRLQGKIARNYEGFLFFLTAEVFNKVVFGFVKFDAV